MIFATVGTQLPFDRLISEIDKWQKNQRDISVFAQIGQQGTAPKNLDFAKTLSPAQFAKKIAKCKVIVSHAGMGSILTARQLGKPIIIMPRRAKFGEHRNDHQLATVEKLRVQPGVYVAEEASELPDLLDRSSSLAGDDRGSETASSGLLIAVSRFIQASNPETVYA